MSIKTVRQRKPVVEKIQEKPTETIDKKDRKSITAPTKATSSVTHRLWTRTVIIVSLMVIVYFLSRNVKEIEFAKQKQTLPLRTQKFQCSEIFLKEIVEFPKCVPKKCGRFISDSLIENQEIDSLLEIATIGISLGGSAGGASILDLHSGALSKGEHFISIYKIPESKNLFKKAHVFIYKGVKSKIKRFIAEQFQIDESVLYLTHPTFFSRITNVTAKTIHDEYWHPHIDKETYESFHYTSLVYLTDYDKDFSGGRFIFIDGQEKNRTQVIIEPKRGRVSGFTSGAENVHYVEKVNSGTRYALTISFTCDPKKAIDDPKFETDLVAKERSE